MRGFSIASLVLGYFLVGGGLFAGLSVVAVLEPSAIVAYLLLAAGAFAGGFVAARTSHGSTIIEPTLGAIAVVGTVVGIAAGTSVGETAWAVAADEPGRFVGSVGTTSVVGALLGAFVGERVFGEAATRSWLPWIPYAALSVFGGCLLGTLATFTFVSAEIPEPEIIDDVVQPFTGYARQATLLLAGIAAGCAVAGIAVGASARVRPLVAAAVGGALGVAGFFALAARTGTDREVLTVVGLAAAGGLTTAIASELGWAVVGKRGAA
ncbi:MAG: hypothetical protein KIT31_28540 [Deltaproteobacteria bacterium]|nr:hypothetical protein [Deltaproteobacteria bacterium]